MNTKILVIDNYDSFTYNLVQMIEETVGYTIDVLRNDAFDLEELEKYDQIICSPGPGIPQNAGKLLAVIRRYATSKKILGVCLGHQAIAEAFGGSLENLSKVYHGVATPIEKTLDNDPVFHGFEKRFEVGRYHSWVVSETGFPDCLEITARDENGQIMALSHKEFPVKGVQFHPESVLTPEGQRMIENFIKF